jgi:ribosomal peptide maturation radical SAM protein 1
MIEKQNQSVDVSLVCMPWGETHRPNLALSLIKPTLGRAGITARVVYANVQLSEWIGYTNFGHVASGMFGEFLGEWLFSRAAFPDDFVAAGLDAVSEWLPTAKESPMSPSTFGEDWQEVLSDMRDAKAFDLCRWVAEETAGSRVVGLTCNVNQLVPAIAAARAVKEARPDTVVILGGAQVDGEMGDEILRAASWIDAVYKGESEVGVVEAVEWGLGRREAPPLEYVSYRRPDGEIHVGSSAAIVEDMNSLPFPDYDDFFERVEDATDCDGNEHPVSGLMFESARGCWWGAKRHCTFCGLNRESMAFRCKDPDRVLEEVLYLSDKYTQLSFYCSDNILSHGYLKTLLPRLVEEGLGVEFFYETKSNLRRADVKLYRDARLRVIQPGVESFSTPVLDLMDKGVTGLQNVYMLKLCAQYGVEPAFNILTGFPGEKEEHYKQQIEWIPKLVHFHYPGHVGDFTLQRFSPMHFDAGRFGIRNIRAKAGYELLFPKAKADLDKLAFYFDYDRSDGRPDAEYRILLRRVTKRWRKRWGTGNFPPRLTYRRGRTFLVVTDDRHRSRRLKFVLSGVDMQVLLACEDIVSVAKIAEATGATEEEVSAILRDLEQRDLVLTEGKKALSLVLPHPKRMDMPFSPKLEGKAKELWEQDPRHPGRRKRERVRTAR